MHRQGVQFEKVFVQVRNTLEHIAERAAGGIAAYAETHSDTHFPVGVVGVDPSARLLRALIHYVTWHEHVLAIADLVYRVEDADMNAVCRSAQANTGSNKCVEEEDVDDAAVALALWGQFLQTEQQKEDLPETSWAELEAVSPAYTARAKVIADTLGYCTSDKRDIR